jgi:hypothetical protein
MWRSVRTIGPGLLLAALSGAAAPAMAQERLFDSQDVLQLRITADFGALMHERDSLKLKEFPGVVTYRGRGGDPVSVEVSLKLRGHWRRQPRNCDFAPILVDVARGARSGTIFEDQGDLKLVTHCRTRSPVFEQYVLREYLVYQLANVLMPVSLRARLVRATYVDATARRDSVTRDAVFLENEKKAAARNDARVLDVKGALWEDVDPELGALVSLFEYMVGGTDWSMAALHNIVLYQNITTGAVWPMAYDFDWTGIVWTSYAVPDYRLPIKSVRQRLYRGACRTVDEWAPILARFQEKKGELYAVYDSVPGLDRKYVRQTKEYLDEFFEVIGDPRKVKREIVDTCHRGT